ncbi:hypothetical protein TrST_g11337 [Triparma strigata]|uniref:Sulfatase N-terminal domain-containing protein n=1 Tax=Triparma strigata TaxID=1606541 RepID=A0A9W7AL85_9STRA|nr:hypothetical protein TrST_g11337 [Triparma strigata]
MYSLVSKVLSLALAAGIYLATSSEAKTPNVVFILTDDQSDAFWKDYDSQHQPKLRKFLSEQGATVQNSFSTTPVCCPSRSSIYTGKYIHNLGVYNNSGGSGGCASLDWQDGPEKDNVAYHLSSLGVKSSFAGKYLNNYGLGSNNNSAFAMPGCMNVTRNREESGMDITCSSTIDHVPRGWDNWHGLAGNSVYYNYTISNNGVAEQHGDNYEDDYLIDYVKNTSLAFMEDMVAEGSPFFITASVPAAHEPADPAPQHAGYAEGIKAPRTPNYNVVMEDERHWMAAEGLNIDGNGMNASVASFVDLLYRRRLAALQSVDDMIEEFVTKLDNLGVLDNTYVIYTNDNGYHLGQFGIPIDKRQPYESDLRVLMFVRGPGIEKNVTIDNSYALNIDIAPTILSFAGATPEQIESYGFDGKPLDELLKTGETDRSQEFLVEYNGESWDGCTAYLQNDFDGLYLDKVRDGVQCGLRGPWSYVTEPRWNGTETWSSIQDNSNNTYACVRNIDGESDFQLCEWISGEIEAFDLVEDEFQMKNLAVGMDGDELSMWTDKIEKLRSCAGATC